MGAQRFGFNKVVTVAAAALAGCIALAGCGGERPNPSADPDVAEGPASAAAGDEAAPVAASLKAHSAELREDIIEVTDTVAVAVGFGLGNSILVDGDACAFVVDTTESREIAARILERFRELTDNPIEAIIYTHNHADHIFGADVFEDALGDGRKIEVYAHETTAAEVNKAINVIRPILSTRSARMFGTYLEPGDNGLVNAGLGPHLGVTGPTGGSIGYIPPTKTFADELTTDICGRTVTMRHAPGETDDQIYVWLPDEKVLMPGDNIYRAFPNLYTIRGTSYRDVAVWARSLDGMRRLGAEHLVPSHTRPLSGADKIRKTLTAYADGIRFTHDQTVRQMNKGLPPDDIVEAVVLPPHLKEHPFLQEHYGTVRWSARSIYDGYLGWFNGDGAALDPARPAERAEALAALAADETTLADAAARALNQGRFALAAEFATYAIDADADVERARRIKADALAALGRASVSPNGRNYLLTQARELRGEIKIEEGVVDARSLSFTRSAPIANFMAALPVNLNAEAALDIEKTAEFRFSDTGQTFLVEVRRGVAVVTEASADAEGVRPDVVVETTTDVWIDLLIGRRRPGPSIATGALKFPDGLGDILAFGDFMQLFQVES